ncbi:MAG: FAD-dependent thymidylate synthase [Bacilli bacterium]|nr:FAD-dependent thymidylate synthase [Bacilli bacterium]
MKKLKMRVELLPHTPFLKSDGTFDKEKAIDYSAKIAGECYEPDGWSKLKDEPTDKSARRAKLTLDLEHHSVYDHINIGFEITNMPKIIAMLLNNEKQYNTSEKSARYTPVVRTEGSIISAKEEKLYNKWMDIFSKKIKDRYGHIYDDRKITKLAQENSRYLVTVFMPTQMIHTVPFGQLNRIVGFMKKMISNESKDDFTKKLIPYFEDFINCFNQLNVLEDRLQANRKNRNFTLLSTKNRQEYFGDTYSVNYKGSFAQLAQAHRHRTIDYEMKLLDTKEYYVPPILKDDEKLVDEWLKDISSVADVYPQGQLVMISESGTYDNFILKAKERLCSAAQLEIANQTKDTLVKYTDNLKTSNHPLAKDISLYDKGARCSFPDYKCPQSCKFDEGILLKREI